MTFSTRVSAVGLALNSTVETESASNFILPTEAESDQFICSFCDEPMVLMDVDDSQIDHERRTYECLICRNAEPIITGWMACNKARTAAA